MEQVPTSRKKLLRFLRDQSKEIEDFVKETDETRFYGTKPGKVNEEENMEVDLSDSDSHISELDVISEGEGNISGISELSESEL